MNSSGSFEKHDAQKREPSIVEMVEGDLHKPEWFSWWYRIAAPPKPQASSTVKQREIYRRGKLISIALFAEMLIALIVLLTVGIFVNHGLIINLAATFVLLAIAAFLNRRGIVIVSGILTVIGLDLSIMGNMVSSPILTAFLLPVFDLLVIPELFAVSLLPPVAVFFDAGFHILFIFASLTFLWPKDDGLRAILQTPAFQDALARPIVIQILVAVITFLWVRNATRAIERANKATSIATLERETAEAYQREVEEKRQLEESIEQIVQVHTQVANGDFSARVPSGNMLWRVAGSLNNLLSRMQRSRQETLQLQKTNEALMRFLQERRLDRDGAIPWRSTGTLVDILVQQHNARYQSTQFPTQPQQRLDSWGGLRRSDYRDEQS